MVVFGTLSMARKERKYKSTDVMRTKERNVEWQGIRGASPKESDAD